MCVNQKKIDPNINWRPWCYSVYIYILCNNMQDKVFTYRTGYVNTLIECYSKVICAACKYPLEYPVKCETLGLICNRCSHDSTLHLCESKCDCCYENKYNIDGDYTTKSMLSNLAVICPNNAVCKWRGKRSQYLDHKQECNNRFFTNCPFCQTAIEKKCYNKHECDKSSNWLKLEENSKIAHFINGYKNIKNMHEKENTDKIKYFKNVICSYLTVNLILSFIILPQFAIEAIFYLIHYSPMGDTSMAIIIIAFCCFIFQLFIRGMNIYFADDNKQECNKKDFAEFISIQVIGTILSIGLTLVSIINITLVQADICEYNKPSILLHYLYCCGCLLVDLYRFYNFSAICNTLNFIII